MAQRTVSSVNATVGTAPLLPGFGLVLDLALVTTPFWKRVKLATKAGASSARSSWKDTGK